VRRALTVAAALAFLPARGLVAQSGGTTSAGTTAPAGDSARPARTIARLVASPSLAGSSPMRPTWSPDGARLAFLWNTESRPRELWWTTRAGDAPVRLTRFTEATPRCVPSEFAWLPAGDALVVLCGGDVWRVGVAGGAPQRLTTGANAGDLTLSPDGTTLAWLRDGDLWTMPLAGGTPVRRTTLGVAPPDSLAVGTYWRPDREVGRATWASDAPPYAWSPDSRTIALHVVDRRELPLVPFPSYLGAETRPHALRRSYPGQPNEARTVRLFDVASATVRDTDLPEPQAWRVVEMQWAPNGMLYIDRERDDATERAIVTVLPEVAMANGGFTRTARAGDPVVVGRSAVAVYRDRRPSRVYTDIGSAVGGTRASATLLFTSDREDRYRVYQPSLAGPDSAPTAITPADADVEGAPILRGDRVFWISSAPDPSQRHVWMRTPSSAAVRLTSFPGINAPIPSPDGRTLAVLASADTMPPELFMMEARAGAPMRRVTVSPPAEFRRHTWLPARYVQVPSRTPGVSLHLRILEPPGMDRTTRQPVLIGPAYSNTVRNRWAGLYGMFQQHLAVERGYVVVQADMRGSTGYGRAFREAFLMDWGGGDLDDLEDVVRWLRAQPHVDPQRVGIWGSSYGGTLTVYSLFRKPGLFNAGVAGAPATDPYAFGSDDVAIVRTPQAFPATFARGALQWATALRDPLMLIHGLMDDVVPFRTTAVLSEELMRLGKDFELVIAPGATHGWTARPHHAAYLLGRLVDFFDRKMPAGR
jgi:dipeptidyl-peptidase-4